MMHVIIDIAEAYLDECVMDKQMCACLVYISIDALAVSALVPLREERISKHLDVQHGIIN